MSTVLIDGKTITGFANVEEDFSDAAVGRRVMPSADPVLPNRFRDSAAALF